ncbi:MAG: hypothetical protein LBK27_07360 [Treponema sp.]|nr:hypothetical protein [Treponema sp.]
MEKFGRSLVFFVVLFGVLSCENPFKTNLGPKVDITPPVLNLLSPVPGQDVYIRGITPFKGTASDDRGVARVEVTLDQGSSWQTVGFNAETGEWAYDLNTLATPQGTSRADGRFFIKFRALDNDGRSYVTNDLGFYIKNGPPQLDLLFPEIKSGKLTGAATDPVPNFNPGDSTHDAENAAYAQYLAGNFSSTRTVIDEPDSLPTGTVIRGVATDRDGIHPGYPQIMFYAQGDAPGKTDPLNEDNWKPAELAPAQRGKILTAKEFWYTLVQESAHIYEEMTADNSEIIRIAKLQEFPAITAADYLDVGKTYYYRLRVKDLAGRMSYYPPDDDPADNMGFDDGFNLNMVDGFRGPGTAYISQPGPRPITQTLKAPTEKPLIEAVQTPYDVSTYITGMGGASNTAGSMALLPASSVPADAYHPYINSGSASYKHGDFVFQVLASHTGLIAAELAEHTTLTYEYYTFPPGPTPSATGELNFDRPANSDAYGGLNIELPGRAPVTEGKVYQFSSGAVSPGGFAGRSITSGSHGTSVQEGMYKFTVTASSASSSQSRTFTIYVDKTDPGIQINVIEGAVQGPSETVDGQSDIETYYVNGHVKVRLIAYENQTLLRNHTVDTKKEQKFFISTNGPYSVKSGGITHNVTDYSFPGGTAPDFLPQNLSTPPGLDYFASSTIVLNTRDIIQSSGTYYLYMFDRDAAFNAGYKFIKLYIDQAGDDPVITPEDTFTLNLSGPDALLDPANAGNRLMPGNVIALALSDDDSLLLSDDPSVPGHPDWATADRTLVKIGRESDAPGSVDGHEPLKTLDIARIRSIFGQNSSYRQSTTPAGVVKEKDVQIRLTDLNSAITGNVNETNNPADGKYYLEITVFDHSGVKHWITEEIEGQGGEAVASASTTLKTWIAVDSSGPRPVPGTFSPADGSREKNAHLSGESGYDGVNFPTGYITIEGRVGDPNELQKLEILPPYKTLGAPPGYQVTNAGTDYRTILDASVPGQEPDLIMPHAKGTDYEYNFSTNVDVELGPGTADLAERVFTFRATDKFGNIEIFEVKYRVDKVKPVVSLLKNISTTPISAPVTGNAANGILEFMAGLVEENPHEMRYWLLPSASDTPVEGEAPSVATYNTGTVIPKNNWYESAHDRTSYTWRLNSVGLAEGWYQLYIIALDAAGNYSIDPAAAFGVNLPLMKLQTVYIKQDTDNPLFSQIRPDNHFVGAGSLRVSGRVTDDDGFAPGTQVQVSFYNGSTWTAWANMETNTLSNQNRTIAFNGPIPLPGAQATLQYRLRVSDDPAKKLGPDLSTGWTKNPQPDTPLGTMLPAASYAAAATENTYSYTYDTKPPELYFDTIRQFNQPFSALPDYFYIGIVENRINPLVPTPQIPVAGITFNYENSGGATSPGGAAALATHITKVAWTAAEESADLLGETFYISAEADSESPAQYLKGVHAAMPAGTPPLTIYRIPSGILNGKKPWAPLAEGSHSIQLIAVDEAGNSSSTTFSFYKDTAAPSLDFEEIVNTLGYTSLTSSGPISTLSFTGDPATAFPKLTGKFVDRYTALRRQTYDNPLDTPAFTYHLYNVREAASISASPLNPAGDTVNFIELTPTGGVRVPMTLPMNGYNWADTDGGLSMPWAIDLKIGEVAADIGEQTAKWKMGLTQGRAIPDGLHLITITVKDLNGNEATYAKILFRTDNLAPVPAVTSPPEQNAIYTVSAYSPFTISGTAVDANLSGLSLRIRSSGTPRDLMTTNVPLGITATQSEIEINPLTGAAQTGTGVLAKKIDWTYAVPASEFSAGGNNDTCSVFINAVDASGVSTELEWRFIKDDTPVAVTFSSMESSGDTYLNSTQSQINGYAYDANRVAQLQGRIEKWEDSNGTTTTGDKTGAWNTAAPSYDWFSLFPDSVDGNADGTADSIGVAQQNQEWELRITANSTDPDTARKYLPEGTYRLRIRTSDFSIGTGHAAETGYKVFHVNPNEPVLLPDNTSPYIKGAGSSVTLTGKASDAGMIKQVRARASGGSSSTATVYWPGSNTTYNDSTANPADWTLTLNSLDLSSGITVYLEAEDWSGRTAQRVLNFTLDNTKPGLEVLYPQETAVKTTAPFDRLMGRDTIRGTGSDDKGLEKVEYSLGWAKADPNNDSTIVYADAIWSDTDDAYARWDSTGYSWSLTFTNINSLASNSAYVKKAIPGSGDPILGGGGALNAGNPLDNNIWVLPVLFKVTDLAGNEEFFTRYYWVDPYGDLPKVTMGSPKDNGVVGGGVTVTGSAIDSHGRVENVVYRVLDDANTPIALAEPESLFPADSYSNSAALTGGDGAAYGSNAGRWRLANIAGNVRTASVQWNFKINTTGQLDPTVGTSRPIYIEVMAWDSAQNADGGYVGPTAIPAGTEANENGRRKQNGWITRIKVTVETGVPVFETVKIYRGSSAIPTNEVDITKGIGGTVYVEALVTEDQGLDSISWMNPATKAMVRINLDPDQAPAPATAAGAWNDAWAYKQYEPGAGGNPYPGSHVYKVHVPVNLDLLTGSAFPNGAEIFDFELLALDFSLPAHHPRTNTTSFRVDRFAPLGEYTGNSSAMGTNYLLQGRIWDRDGNHAVTVYGNQRVEIWLRSADGKFYRATESGGNPVEIPAGSSVQAHVGRYVNSSDVVTENVYGGLPATLDAAGRRAVPRPATVITIDHNGTDSLSGANYTVGWYPDGVYHEWTAEINTASLPAGPLTACFLVYDDAGNATYYEHSLTVMNGGPILRGVSLATDLYNNGAPALNTFNASGVPVAINQERTVSANYQNISGFTARNNLIHLRAMVTKNTAAGFTPYTYTLSYINTSGAPNIVPITGLAAGSYYEIVDPDASGFSSWESVGAPDNTAGTIFRASGKAWRGTGTARELELRHNLTGGTEANTSFVDPETGASYPVTTVDFTYTSAYFAGGVNAPFISYSQTVGSPPDLDANGHEILVNHPRFILELRDARGITSFTVLAIPVVNLDAQKPSLVLYDFNPKHETGREAAAATPRALNTANPVLGSYSAINPVNKDRGGLYNTTGSAVNVRKSGHIEPRKNTNALHGGTLPTGTLGAANFAYDTLSGEVILRGWARDSRRVEKISLEFAGEATGDPALKSIDILAWNPTEKKLTATPAATRGGVALAYTSEVMNLTGHWVEWAFIWNTQDYPQRSSNSSPVVVFNQLQVTAKAWDFDASGNHDSPVVSKLSTDATPAAYSAITVNLAPYITGIDRNFSTMSNVRTKMGYYTLNRSEGAVVNGFNLSSPTASVTLSIGSVDVGTKTPAAKTIGITVPSGALHGSILLSSQSANGTAATVPAVNNDARVYTSGGKRTNSWNRENTAAWNEDFWTDERMARIWDSQDTDRFGGNTYAESTGGRGPTGTANAVSGTGVTRTSEHGEHVSMTINPVDGKLFGAWIWEDQTSILWGTPNQWGKILQQWTDPFDNTDIHFSTSTTNSTSDRVSANGKPLIVYNMPGTSSGLTPYELYMKGGLFVFDLSGPDPSMYWDSEGIRTGYWVQRTHQYPANAETATRHTGFKADRFRNPRIITSGMNIHVSYHDQITRSLKYWYGREGMPASGTSDTNVRDYYWRNQTVATGFPAQRWVNLDGGWEYNDIRDSTTNSTSATTYGATNRVRGHNIRGGDFVDNVGGLSPAGTVGDTKRYYTDFATTQRAAGLWNAIGLTTTGTPVIFYYDMTDQKLMFTASSSAAPVTGDPWSAPAAITTAQSKTGEYVSARIGGNGHYHLAYLDRAAMALVYARSTDSGANWTTVEVDRTGAVGRWTDLSLDANGNPWIVYEDLDRQGTYDGVKVAYIPGLSAYDTTRYTGPGNWETMNVPSRAKNEADARLNIENAPTTALQNNTLGWIAAVGYQEGNGGRFRIAKFVKED